MVRTFKANEMTPTKKIANALNGYKKALVSVAIITLQITIIIIASKISGTVNRIATQTANNAHRIEAIKLDFDDKLSYLDMNGCKVATDNAKALAVMRAKKRTSD